MRRLFVLSLAFTLNLGPLSCGGGTEGDCVSLCEEAQDRDCTSITGDCSEFCSALFSIEDRSGCGEERESYQECLDEEGVCHDSCDGKENALSTCVGSYCLTRGGDDDCAVLISSF